MNLSELRHLFAKAGATRLYAKKLAENDNSKNQIYFAGAVETLNVFPSEQIYAENTKKGPSFKARLNFGWLRENGEVAQAPNAQLILYSQYPEVRFSGFLRGCESGPNLLMADRGRAEAFPSEIQKQLPGRVLFLGVTSDRRVLGFVAAGNSEIAAEFDSGSYPTALCVFKEISLPQAVGEDAARAKLLEKLRDVHRRGWIDSVQLDSHGILRPCNAPQCGGFTLEAQFGIAKNSKAEPDFLGWEVKQHNVSNFDRLGAGAITLMTPEPTGGFYQERGVEAFVRKFGYPDRSQRPDRLNFGGVHRVGQRHPTTGLTLSLIGYDHKEGEIKNANGCLALITGDDEVAAEWAFSGLLKHWSRKHTKAAYVPSQCRKEPQRQYCYGKKVRLAHGTDPLRLLKALASGAVFYDPGIKLEHASESPEIKRRSQFRVISGDISVLYSSIETVTL